MQSVDASFHELLFCFGQKSYMHVAMTIQMKMETNIENHLWATKMAKHVTMINRQLQSRLLGLIHRRLFGSNRISFQKTGRKRPKIKSILPEEEN